MSSHGVESRMPLVLWNWGGGNECPPSHSPATCIGSDPPDLLVMLIGLPVKANTCGSSGVDVFSDHPRGFDRVVVSAIGGSVIVPTSFSAETLT